MCCALYLDMYYFNISLTVFYITLVHVCDMGREHDYLRRKMMKGISTFFAASFDTNDDANNLALCSRVLYTNNERLKLNPISAPHLNNKDLEGNLLACTKLYDCREHCLQCENISQQFSLFDNVINIR